ncbi:MAG TPA: hypothetical protein PKV78_09590 [Methanoculleus thermophilus]|nr:hypothetical protein [Methanoculleus thermophilus]
MQAGYGWMLLGRRERDPAGIDDRRTGSDLIEEEPPTVGSGSSWWSRPILWMGIPDYVARIYGEQRFDRPHG